MAAKYDRIAADLRTQILAGKLQPGERMRAEDELVGEYSVSRNTLRQALAALESEGLIVRKHGTGTFVRMARQRICRTTDRYQWEKDRVLLSQEERGSTGATEKDTGLEMSDLKFSAVYSELAAPNDLAKVFEVELGSKLLRRVYTTRKHDEKSPLSVVTSYLVHDVVAQNPDLLKSENEPWPGGTQHQLSTIGIELDRIVDNVTARPPTAEEVESLDIGVGVAVMVMRKVSVDTTGRTVEVSDIVWPGDRIELQYTTQLTPWPKRPKRSRAPGSKN
ncbi:transcriptional regulator, GntR family [Lentzea albidocapillata subsp. violacea]|uniref:Transcriptional regulator, GntR family n=1 Tax=Lentzea albidocapillata subsp. violacea TaxID=128104 RepID=A0A1G9UTY5_9PSEU|nr:GntR family transcriptional regulator [Lentzea albidocapillata]SDM63326.1 transcriptional regulator, GntR family [Lentzea albidocapillata subsp. violacea]